MYLEPNPSLAPSLRPRLLAPVLESLLARSAMQIRVVAELHKCGYWYTDAPSQSGGLFHLVGSGRCLVNSDELSTPIELETGDLVIFPHGTAHRLSGDRSPDDKTNLICGEFRFAGKARHPLNWVLPGCFVVRASQAAGPFRQLATIMAEMVHADYEGRNLMLNKLADALFTLAC
jgi:AraC family transcriptional activator of mtrCDE